MKKYSKAALFISLCLPVAQAFATCAGGTNSVYALEEVATSTTNSDVESSNDAGLVMATTPMPTTFSVTTGTGNCGKTCANATDTYFPTSTTFTQYDMRLINTSSTVADRENPAIYIGATPNAGQMYSTAELMDSNSCTCQETISSVTHYFHKVCLNPTNPPSKKAKVNASANVKAKAKARR